MSLTRSVFRLRHVLALILLTVLCHGTAKAAANDAVYTVENVQVDVTASDAATARNLAFMQAQQAALRQLAVKLAGPDAAARLKMPDDITLSTMVKDYETTAEQLSSVRYLGTYTVRFRGPATRGYFTRQGLASAMAAVAAGAPPPVSVTTAGTAVTTTTTTTTDTTTATNQPLLVLPFYQLDGQMNVWGDDNPWLAAWQKLSPGGATTVVAPIGDASDIADIDGGALSYDRAALHRMAHRYGAGDVAILLAAPSDRGSPPGTLTVSLYRTDQDAPRLIRHLTLTPQAGEADDAFYARAALATRTALQQDWPQPGEATTTAMADTATAVATGDAATPAHHGDAFIGVPATGAATESAAATPDGAGRIHAEAHFAGLSQWLQLQRALRNTDGVSAVHVGSLSPQGASVNFAYRGTPAALRISLTEAGIAATPNGANAYELHMANSGATGSP